MGGSRAGAGKYVAGKGEGDVRDERMDPGPEETGHKSVWQDGEQDEGER